MARGTQALPPELQQAIDHQIVLHRVTWEDFERILAIRGDAAGPRLTYLKGDLELMSPSRNHEFLKSMIGRLLEAYAGVHGLSLAAAGSWTLRSAPRERAVEPDECYLVGPPADRDHPDLAIEVVWTSGGLDKLEVYRGLGVGEVWFWRNGKLEVYCLQDKRYERAGRSALFPDLDLDRFASFVEREDQTQAVEEYRASFRQG